MANSNLVFIGIKGTVLALDRETGREVWKTLLKGSTFVNVVLDDDALIATTKGVVFCLDAANGNIRWKNSLPGFGWGLATIGASGPSPVAAMAQYEFQQQQEAAAG